MRTAGPRIGCLCQHPKDCLRADNWPKVTAISIIIHRAEMKVQLAFIFAAQLSSCFFRQVLSQTLSKLVVIDSGPVIGISDILPNALSPVNKYLGIPYAAPVQRFVPAVKPAKWMRPFNASNCGPTCIQSFATGERLPHLR